MLTFDSICRIITYRLYNGFAERPSVWTRDQALPSGPRCSEFAARRLEGHLADRAGPQNPGGFAR
jgi:hypothetical protein